MTQPLDAAGPVLVTGGTGTLGREVVRGLAGHRRRVRILSRQPGTAQGPAEVVRADLRTPDGLDRAVDGVSVIVHCASATKGDAEATSNLVRAATALPQPPHLVFISIVGADRVSVGYISTKLAAEQVVVQSGLPWSLMRATQFYDLILAGAAKAARLPVVPVPARFPVQPVHAGEVAARLVRLAVAGPAGRVPDFGGPQVLTAAELVRTYLDTVGRRRPVVELWTPGTRTNRAVRSGALVVQEPAQDHGVLTWKEFLAARVA